jgi:hypothetical protein
MKIFRKLISQWQVQHLERHKLEQQALSIARNADNMALALAKAEIDRRLEGMNELRAQITDERGRYVLRDMYDEQHAQLRDNVDARLKALENIKSNMEGRLWAIGAAISTAVVILNVALYYFRAH